MGLLVTFAIAATAHENGAPESFGELATAWEFAPAVVAGLALMGHLYARGVSRLWAIVGIGKGIRRWEVGCFASGWMALVVALVSPLHSWGHALFSAHMVQHEILMLAAAPLLVLGRPMIAFLKGIPVTWVRALMHPASSRGWKAVWRWTTFPLTAWIIHAVALWVWHIPFLFQLTLGSDLVHSLQHFSFLASALLFWWAIIHGRRRMMGYGIAVLYVFTTAMHSGLLGALITFSGRLLYPIYAASTAGWGLSPLEDQQLGGLVMWVPAGLVYVVSGLALFAGWLRESDSRIRQQQKELGLDPTFRFPVG